MEIHEAFISNAFQGINRVLEIFGLRLLRTNAPVRSFGLFFEHLKSLGFDFRTVIDVGGKARLNAEYFLVAAAAENGEVTFNVHDDGLEPVFPGRRQGARRRGAAHPDATARFTVVRTLEHPVLLKLDTQGAEIEALRGLATC